MEIFKKTPAGNEINISVGNSASAEILDMPSLKKEAGDSKSKKISRRKFLARAGFMGLGFIGTYMYVTENPKKIEDNNSSSNSTIQDPEKPTLSSENNFPVTASTPKPDDTSSPNQEYHIIDTVKESVIFNVGQIAAGSTAKALNLPIGNASMEALLDKAEKDSKETEKIKISRKKMALSVAALLWEITLGMPIKEELLFRFLPNAVLNDKTKNPRWEAGLATSMAFAAVHNIYTDENTGKRKFSLSKIPFCQFTGGLFFWKMMREKGYRHAVSSHVTVNLSAAPISMLENILYFAGTKAAEKLKITKGNS